MTELLACPFCGSKAKIEKGDPIKLRWLWVQCEKCAASSQHSCNLDRTIAAWNRRSPPEPAEIEKAREDVIEAVERMPKVVKVNPKACLNCGHGPSRHYPGATTGACEKYDSPLDGEAMRLEWAVAEAERPGDVPYRIKMALKVLAEHSRLSSLQKRKGEG